MNEVFFKEAFSLSEQDTIIPIYIETNTNPVFNSIPGNITNDKVFLLSIDEVKKYFSKNELRRCAPTAYAEAQGAKGCSTYKTKSGEAACNWWLRSPGYV